MKQITYRISFSFYINFYRVMMYIVPFVLSQDVSFSVRLSVTLRYCAKTPKPIVQILSPLFLRSKSRSKIPTK